MASASAHSSAGDTGTVSRTASEDAIRHLKASQSAEAAFHGAGIPSPPAGLAAMISDYVRGETRAIPLSNLAHMTPGTGALATAAASGVSMMMAQMTPTQRDAMKSGVNPFDTAAVERFRQMLVSNSASGFGNGATRGESAQAFGAQRPNNSALSRESTLSATGAVSFARELGMSPSYAGLMVGASNEMREALKNSIQKGTAIKDEHVKNMNDVGAVLAAVRAGKLKPDDPRLPTSVKQIMKDMKEKGIDPATAKPDQVKKYLKDHPNALKAADGAAQTDSQAAAKKSDAELTDAIKAAGTKASASATPAGNQRAKSSAKPSPVPNQRTL